MYASDFVINAQSLSKSYNGVQALKSLDLQVPKNSIFGFLGPNGAGTLAPALQIGSYDPPNWRFSREEF